MIDVTFRLCESVVAKDFEKVYYLWSQCSYEALHGKTWQQHRHTLVRELLGDVSRFKPEGKNTNNRKK